MALGETIILRILADPRSVLIARFNEGYKSAIF